MLKRKCEQKEAESIIHFNLNAHLRRHHLVISDQIITYIGKG